MLVPKESKPHWRRLVRLFSAVDQDDPMLAAASALGVDAGELRLRFDRQLPSAELHDLDTRMLAAADGLVVAAQIQLVAAEALREEMWIAQQVSHRDAHSTIVLDIVDDHGVLRQHGFYPWESAIAEILAEENI